jgi:hypothetical protein
MSLEGMSTPGPQGFWQVLSDSTDEQVVSFRDTTTAARPALGFSILTKAPTWSSAPRSTPAPSEVATPSYLDGRIDGDHAKCEKAFHGGHVQERWRRLSGTGATPLAGAWRSGEPEAPWLHVTAGHYGVMSTTSHRPQRPAHGDEWSDSEVMALWEGFGVNAGARLETDRTFDHWPMLGDLAGHEVRKHETSRVGEVHPNASPPPSRPTKIAKSGIGSTEGAHRISAGCDRGE